MFKRSDCRPLGLKCGTKWIQSLTILMNNLYKILIYLSVF